MLTCPGHRDHPTRARCSRRFEHALPTPFSSFPPRLIPLPHKPHTRYASPLYLDSEPARDLSGRRDGPRRRRRRRRRPGVSGHPVSRGLPASPPARPAAGA